MDNKKKIYIGHSRKSEFNDELYLPLSRLEYLTKYKLLLPTSNSLIEAYFKDLMDDATFIIICLDKADLGTSMEVKYAVTLNKPLLMIYNKNYGLDSKYQKMENKIKSYSSLEEFNEIVLNFIKESEEEIRNKKNNTLVLGVLDLDKNNSEEVKDVI